MEVKATTAADVQTWNNYLTQASRDGNLRRVRASVDPALPSRTIERFEQYHQGVKIWGAQIVRDSQQGTPVSLFGDLAAPLSIAAAPGLTAAQAEDRLRALSGGGDPVTLQTAVELVVLPLDSGDARLAYTAVAAHLPSDVSRIFIDATTGQELTRYSAIETQSAAIGKGTGVIGDIQKMSVSSEGGVFYADDLLRPPFLTTYDMKGNFTRLLNVENGSSLSLSERALDSDNVWTDPPVVDAHSYIGWTYDYYFRRFGRHGLDDHDRPITILVNGLTQAAAATIPLSSSIFGQYVENAFWCDTCGPNQSGSIFFGNGFPAGSFDPRDGKNWGYLAGGLDVVAHELSHAVTSATSNLIYQNESGALNEAFSDIIGTSVEFFYQPAGSGIGKADYLCGEDVVRGVLPGALNGLRSLENPAAYGDPDHYSKRFVGTSDNGGVHTNSAIGNQAFYLAIEGGVNRTSLLSVTGVGAANREQMERVFYRAFTQLMPSNSTYSTARAATIQAARDLYGAGSNAERAVTQAWTAVGVL